jgi:hypothetical protein
VNAYDNDPRVEQHRGSFLVTAPNRRWTVVETGQQWDAWPFPECVEPGFDDDAYFRQHLCGRATFTADNKIRELIGDPQ